MVTTKPVVVILAAIVGLVGLASPISVSAAGGQVRSAVTALGNRLVVLKAAPTATSDAFGEGVALSGDTMVVGDWAQASDVGRAYVFTKSISGWRQAAELKGSPVSPNAEFGVSVAISGPVIVVGSDDGLAYVFTRSSTGWHETAALASADRGERDYFGDEVAVFGGTIVVDAPGHAYEAGRAYVFDEAATGWQQVAELKGLTPSKGTRLAWMLSRGRPSWRPGAATTRSPPSRLGRVYVFTKGVSGWHQTAELRGSDTTAADLFGGPAAVSGNVVAVSADQHASQAGRVYVFTETAGAWHQTAELKGSDTTAGDHFGSSLAILGQHARRRRRPAQFGNWVGVHLHEERRRLAPGR